MYSTEILPTILSVKKGIFDLSVLKNNVHSPKLFALPIGRQLLYK